MAIKKTPRTRLTPDLSPPMPTGPGETANRALGGKEDGGKERGAVGGRVRNTLLCILQSGAEAVHTLERERDG